MNHASLATFVVEGPRGFAQRITPHDAAGWKRVSIVSAGAGPHWNRSPSELDAAVRARCLAVYQALSDGLVLGGESWVTLEGAEAAPVLSALAGVEVLGSAADLPLTPLFEYRHSDWAAEELGQLENHAWHAALEEHVAPGQHGFLDWLELNGTRVVPVDPRYGQVVNALVSGLIIQHTSSDDVQADPSGTVRVPRRHFSGATSDGTCMLRGVCLLAHGLPTPDAAAFPASWLVAGPSDGPSWLIAPNDLEELTRGLLVALLVHQGQSRTT